MEGADEVSPRPPPPDQPGVRQDKTRCPCRLSCATTLPREATGGPALPPTTDVPRSCATHTCPAPSPGPGAPTTEDRSSGKCAQALTYSSSLSRPAGTLSLYPGGH